MPEKPKKKKKTGLIIAIVVIVCLFGACTAGSKGSDEKKEITETGKNETEAADAASDEQKDDMTETSENEAEQENAADTAIEETILVDQDGVKVTALELVDDPIWGEGIKVLVENDSAKNVGVFTETIAVNNYMISNLFSTTVAAGKKVNDTIYLSSGGLEEAGIDTIADIEMDFHVFDGDSFEQLFDVKGVQLPTSNSGSVQQKALDDGQVLYEQDGIKIVGKYVDENSFWGMGILLYLENTTDQNVTVQCDNLSVNGFMLTPLFSSQVNAGKMAIDQIDMMQSELEENGITSAEEVELEFHIINPDTYETMVKTEPISFSLK